jgi:hypothetical protein
LPSDIMFFHHSAQDNIVRLGLNYTRFTSEPENPLG